MVIYGMVEQISIFVQRCETYFKNKLNKKLMNQSFIIFYEKLLAELLIVQNLSSQQL